MFKFIQLGAGDPAPDFTQRCTSNERYHFNTVAGRYIVLCFLGSSRSPQGQAALAFLRANRALFDDATFAFFGVSVDAADEQAGLLQQLLPGIRHIWDFDGAVSRAYGALPVEASGSPQRQPVQSLWYVLDPNLRVLRVFESAGLHGDAREVAAYLRGLPPVDDYASTTLNAPVLIVPRVFEPEFCQDLIERYTARGGERSGFMVERQGRTVSAHDEYRKRRKDVDFSESPEYEPLRRTIQKKIKRRIHPEVRKAFQFDITRIERYIVACYDGAEQGFFKAHRDDTTKGTAHRRFACTINLNPGDYTGGDLIFPEFGTRRYRAPLGGAVIFSCSLLHEATPVTQGRRYAFLPFFYDEAARKVREQNMPYLDLEAEPS